MTNHNAIWYVIINHTEQGPLSKVEVLQALKDGKLDGNDQIWRPGFSEWKSVRDTSEFWQPPRHHTSMNVDPPQYAPETEFSPKPPQKTSLETKWSLWKSANLGLLLSAVTLLLQIGNGSGFKLANYAHTASGSTVSYLLGQIIAAPLIFVVVASVRNIFMWRLPRSAANAIWGGLLFGALLLVVLGSLMGYGHYVFSSDEIVSGEARKTFLSDMSGVCIQKQFSFNQNLTGEYVKKYCSCFSQKMAEVTTYKQLGTEVDTNALVELKQKAEAAGAACRL